MARKISGAVLPGSEKGCSRPVKKGPLPLPGRGGGVTFQHVLFDSLDSLSSDSLANTELTVNVCLGPALVRWLQLWLGYGTFLAKNQHKHSMRLS